MITKALKIPGPGQNKDHFSELFDEPLTLSNYQRVFLEEKILTIGTS